MILADENLPAILIQSLRKAGIEVYSIIEGLRGISDAEVIELSRKPPRIILTEDKDFGEWVFAHNEKSISVIFLRYSYLDLEDITSIVVDMIKEKGDSLFGKFTTVTVDKIRFRDI